MIKEAFPGGTRSVVLTASGSPTLIVASKHAFQASNISLGARIVQFIGDAESAHVGM